MARIAQVIKNEERKKVVAKYAKRRAELKRVILSPSTTAQERDAAVIALQKLPKNSSATRVRNRCHLTGRSRGNLRKFGLSRNQFRQLALEGHLPGVRKSSW